MQPCGLAAGGMASSMAIIPSWVPVVPSVAVSVPGTFSRRRILEYYPLDTVARPAHGAILPPAPSSAGRAIFQGIAPRSQAMPDRGLLPCATSSLWQSLAVLHGGTSLESVPGANEGGPIYFPGDGRTLIRAPIRFACERSFATLVARSFSWRQGARLSPRPGCATMHGAAWHPTSP